jgi:tetratricopeptide (TPR) repeat protein
VLISLLEQDHRTALTYFDSAVDIDPNNGTAWCNRGITLRQIGDRDGAIFSLQKALLLDGNDQVARDTLVSMGAERYIPRAARPPAGGEAPLKVGPPAEKMKEEGGALPPEEWGVEDAFEEMEEAEAEEDADERKRDERPRKRRGSKRGGPPEEGSGPRDVICPRCSISFHPEPDDRGRFKCPSCGLVGRFEPG